MLAQSVHTRAHTQTHRIVQYHPLSSLYLSPDSSLHSLALLSVIREQLRQIKMNVFSLSLFPLSSSYDSHPAFVNSQLHFGLKFIQNILTHSRLWVTFSQLRVIVHDTQKDSHV